jgi:prepilin-type N-terminal cleavage/methylation domain-containing protein
MSKRSLRPGRAGFTLIEVILAMTIIATAMIMLATLATSTGRRGYQNGMITQRNYALAQQVARIQVMPFDLVAQLTSGTTQLLVGDFSFNRRLAVTQISTSRYTIKVVVQPIASEFRPDSVTIDRTRPTAGSPLCTTC